jgi:Cft2 family RNA processing exonuclease
MACVHHGEAVSLLEVRYAGGGVHLPRLGLWLDPSRPKPGPVFVSHAHSDHTARHPEVILSADTARLMRVRLGGQRTEHALAYGLPREFHAGEVPFRLTLLPAGHILGSAMAWIEADGKTLLYTGDFKLRPGLAAEACELRPADVLVMETTFGRPHYVFPPEQSVWADLQAFCERALEEGATPVLLAYSLGKSQEILRGLGHSGLEFLLHEQTHRITQVYEEAGMQFPSFARFEAENVPGKVVLWPPGALRSKALVELRNLRRAVVTGWALDASCRYRYGVDAAFPISDHADFPGLLEAVQHVRPRRIWTLHGHAAAFADVLRQKGYDAAALSEPDQLSLVLGC